MSIADKLNYLITTKGLLKDNINKINNVLTDQSTFRSYPQELFNGYLDILNNGTDTLWNNLEKVSASGEEATLENVETAPMKMVLNGNTSQDGTPTPDTPVEVKVVTGENVVSVSGKNKFNIDDILIGTKINDRTFTATHVNGKLIEMDFDPNLKYNIGFKITQDHESNGVFVRIMYTDGTNVVMNSTSADTVSKTILTTKAIQEILLQYSAYNTITTFEDFYIYEETTDTSYVPYSKTDYPINLGDIELCKIGNYQDFPFKAINGNEYYDTLTAEQKNALNYGSWYKHKEINKVVLDGNEQMNFQGSESTPTERTIFRWTLPTYALTTDYLSNKFIKGSSTSNRIVMVGGSNRPYISIDNLLVGINTEDDNNTKLAKFKTWLSNNNVTLYYVLSVPTDTEITNTTLISQLEAIYKAKSVKDKTYITQTNDELPFILDVEAIKEYSVE